MIQISRATEKLKYAARSIGAFKVVDSNRVGGVLAHWK